MDLKYKIKIQKLINSEHLVNWTLALKLLETVGNDPQLTITSYIINTWGNKLTIDFYEEILKWVKENITDSFVLNYLNGLVAPEYLEEWFDSIHNVKKSEPIVIWAGEGFLKEFNKALKLKAK